MPEDTLRAAAEAKISGNAKCLLIELARVSDRFGMTEVLNYHDLSERVAVSPATIYHAINRLIDRGYVVRVERVAKQGSIYRIVA